GVMNSGPFAEEKRPKIFFDGNTMEGMPGEFVRALHRPFGVVAREAEDIFIGEAKNRLDRTLSADGVEEFQHVFLSLSANDVIDILCVERGVGVHRRKVSAPYNLYV